jgi:PEGA domain-containing protein
MRRTVHLAVLVAAMAALVSWPAAALAQRGHPPVHHPEPHHAVQRGAVVFVGGYFYDPFFGPYPWWPRTAYPYPYYPFYDARAVLRVIATPDNAGVYVDGFYAGIVDDFNNFFQGLPLPPGGHEVVIYLEGYRTISRQVYFSPGSTFKLQAVMERLPAGETSELPRQAPPLPPPPSDTYIPPRTAAQLPPDASMTPTLDALVGTLTLQVQPATAEVRVDGQRWASSDGGRFVLQLPIGMHHLEITCAGHRQYSTEFEVRDGETLPINVSLTPDRP